MDGHTDERTDATSYRNATAHLKTVKDVLQWGPEPPSRYYFFILIQFNTSDEEAIACFALWTPVVFVLITLARKKG